MKIGINQLKSGFYHLNPNREILPLFWLRSGLPNWQLRALFLSIILTEEDESNSYLPSSIRFRRWYACHLNSKALGAKFSIQSLARLFIGPPSLQNAPIRLFTSLMLAI